MVKHRKKICIWLGSLIILLLFSDRLMAHGREMPKEAEQVNPVPITEQSVDRGQQAFAELCAHCHGAEARGRSAKEAGLHESPPNLVKRLARHSEGEFLWKIKHGDEEMPSFKDELSDNEIWDIINFIKSRK